MESIVNSLLFNPPPRHNPCYVFSSKIIHLKTSRGQRIAATYLKRKGANVTILYSHANSEDLNQSFAWMRRLALELNVNVMGYDYSGYGASTGQPSEENCYADIEAVYDYLITKIGLNPRQIVLYGRSMGSGPSCHLAAKTTKQGASVGGLILHSAFTSVYRIVMEFGFTLLGDKFINVDKVRSVGCKVLVIHSKNDEIVPFVHGQLLHRATPELQRCELCWLGDGNTHNWHTPEGLFEVMRRCNEFLAKHVDAGRVVLSTPDSTKRFVVSPTQRRSLELRAAIQSRDIIIKTILQQHRRKLLQRIQEIAEGNEACDSEEHSTSQHSSDDGSSVGVQRTDSCPVLCNA